VSEERRDLSRLLRWYPATWRERYGEELGALIEDQLEDRDPTPRFRLSIAWAGLRERAYGAAIVGRSSSPPERARAGVLLVLAAWAAFVIAGASYSKFSEHFANALPSTDRATPNTAFDVVVFTAAIAAGLLVIGVVVAVPAVLRFLRGGGWHEIKRHLFWAAGLSGVTIAGVAGLAPWAHSLTVAQRNGTDAAYGAVFLIWALFGAASVGLWTRATIAIARRLGLDRRTIAIESGLAFGVGAAMATITVATAIWWGSIAMHAPWFLHGFRPGSTGSPFNLQLAGTMTVMLGALVVGEYGVVRIGRSWLALRRQPAE
jgi:hypothetical protein